MNYELPALDERFDIGRVVSRAFAVLGRKAALFIGLTLLISGLPNLLLSALVASQMANADPNNLNPAQMGSFWLTLIVGFITYYIASAALTHASVLEVNGQKPGFAAALKTGVRHLLPLLGMGVLAGIGLMVGFLLLLIPGIILGIMWSVAVPAMVAENLGIMASLSRSRDLTRGSRWRLFALLAVGVLLLSVPTFVLAFATGLFADAAAGITPGITPASIVQMLAGSVVNALFIALIASAYIELRAIRDGTSSEALAGIFA